MLTDTHCHLDMIPDQKITLLRAKEAGVGIIINVGTSIDASRKSIEIAEETDSVDVYATCGIHAQEGPKDIKKYGHLRPVILGTSEARTPESNNADSGYTVPCDPSIDGSKARMTGLDVCIAELKKVAQSSKKVVGIGECGMDFFLEKTDQGPATSDDEKKDQRELFEAQVKLAMELDLPLIIHCRNAWEETFDTISKIKDQKSKLRGVFHSWTGTLEQAKRALDLGFYISFSGIVTFKNAGEIPQVAKMVPEDRILVETDAPFLTPRRSSPTLKFQGASETNEPKNVRITAQFLADLRGVPLDKIAEVTTENAKRLFGID